MIDDKFTPYATGDDPGADVVIERLTRERDEARAKADHYERDWYEAKSKFGTAMAKMREGIRVLERERDDARAVLREARVWIADACDLISTCIPDSSSWMDDGGLADRSDDLEEKASWACGDWTDDPKRALGERKDGG